MSHRARQDVLVRVARRYRDARGLSKARILDEFIVTTGHPRK